MYSTGMYCYPVVNRWSHLERLDHEHIPYINLKIFPMQWEAGHGARNRVSQPYME